MKLVKKAKRGFTLVELVVVIAVIAILAAVSVGAYFGVTESANNSRLEQETKQIHTAIQQVSLGTKQNQSLGNDGLTVSNLIDFESDLKAATGKELKVTNNDVTNVYVPTIRLSTDEYIKPQNSGSKYLTFEYYNPEISGKKTVANVITGDCHIVESTATNNPNSNIKTFFYIDREWWRGDNLTTKVYACNEDGTKTNGSWPGVEPTLVEQLTYEEETIRVYSYDVDLDLYTKMAWTSSVVDATNHTYKTNDIEFNSLGENNLVINNLEESTNAFTPVFGVYEPGKVDYGQFPEKNNQTFYFMDQSWWNANDGVTKVYLFNKETNNHPNWIDSFKDVTLVKSFETDGFGTANVYSITFDVNTYDHMIFVRGEGNIADKSQTIDIAVSEFTDGKNMAFLLEGEEVIKGQAQAKCEVSFDTYDENRWDYGQFIVLPDNFTYHFLDQYWWRGANEANKVFVYAFNSSNNKFKTEWPGDEITISPTSINGTYGILNSYSFTVDLNKYDTAVISSVVVDGETKTVSFQTTDIQLDKTNDMFALNDVLEGEKYTVVKAVKENAKWDYGQVMRDLPEAEPEMKTFYFNATSEWFKDGASITCITKKDGKKLNGNFGEKMELVDYWNFIFKVTVDVNNVDSIAFMRTNFDGTADWGGLTKDITVSTLEYNLITFKNNTNLWDKASEIECKADYVKVELSLYLIGSFNGWTTNDSDYKFTYDDESDVYVLEKNLPAGTEYKVFANDTYYSMDGNSNMTIAEDGRYKFIADYSGFSYEKIGEMESTSVIEENTIYFINNLNYANVKIWAWVDDGENYTGGSWPGADMTLVPGTENVYYYTIQEGIPENLKVIFNNGSGTQTGDLIFDKSKPVFNGTSWVSTY